MSAVDDDVLGRLRSFVAERVDDTDARVDNFVRIGTGRSRENWLFDAEWVRDGVRVCEPLIARRDPLGGLLETDRATEFAVLKALERTNIASPPVRWLDADGGALGRPSLVMVRVAGTCDYYALNGAAPLTERVALAHRLCSLLADVHAVNWRALGLGSVLHDPGPWASLAALDEWEAVRRRDELEPMPEIDLAEVWLRSHAVPSPRTVLVHGDFKVGNVLIDDGRITALLDWELAHLGDPHEDLGWVTQPLRSREHLIAGSWDREQLLAGYAEASGFVVEAEAVAWWNVFAAYKTAVMQQSGLRAFVEGRSDELFAPSAAVLHQLLDAVAAVGA